MISLKTKNFKGGYIALISIIVISVLLLTMGVVISFGGFFTRFTILENEYKEISTSLAEACADMAILKLIENWNYAGGEDQIIDSNSCRIVSVQDINGSQKLIKTKAVYQNSHTNLEIAVEKNGSKINIIFWREIPVLN